MVRVSNAYKQSMAAPLRNRGYIMIVFGLINQSAQSNAKVQGGDFTYYSSDKTVFLDRVSDSDYATLEEGFTKVDGSMFFLPREGTAQLYYDAGLVGNPLVSDGDYTVNITFNTIPIDVKGLTINFGENYPVDFDIVTDAGQIIEVRGNASSEFITEDVLTESMSLSLVFHAMRNTQSRVRIRWIRFGYGLLYDNESVVGSTLDSYLSPIGTDLPQIDFSVTLENRNQYFNVDNPKSASNFIETGQQMKIYYGYEVVQGGEVEWILGNTLSCSDWEADDFTATIRCQDMLREMGSEYYKGAYVSGGTSYYDLAVDVLSDAGISDYIIDPRLKSLFTKNPIPRAPHKQALQLIANACRCTLSQTRSGLIEIKSSFLPDVTVSTETEADYSQVSNILTSEPKDEYFSLAGDYSVTDGTMFFLPRNPTEYVHTGYVSSEMSDSDGSFDTNPVITLVLEAAYTFHGLGMIFGSSTPNSMTVRTYNAGSLLDEYQIAGSIDKIFNLEHEFYNFDTMEIEFTGTENPYNRIVLNYFTFGDITDFTMTRNDMMSAPISTKQERVKEVIVPTYTYQAGEAEERLLSEEITVAENETQTFFMSEPSYAFRAEFNGESANLSILDSGNYYVRVQFLIAGTYVFELFGYRYKVIERQSRNTLNSIGKTIYWSNPLISNMGMANDLSDWLGDYYGSNLEYEYATRGNPEIDATDIVYQENEFTDNMLVTIYKTRTTFNQSFSGRVLARRKVG